MSTSIIYHAFGAVNYRLIRTEFCHGHIYFRIRKREQRCASCGSYRVKWRGMRTRVIQTVPIGEKKVFFIVENRRFFCGDCGGVRFEKLEIALPKKRYDRRLEHYIAFLCRCMTIRDVACHVGLSWDTVKDIDKRRLARARPKAARLRKIRYLGIDEVAKKKRHHYLTICVDLDTGDVVHVGEGRSEEALLSIEVRSIGCGSPP
jgi:transposase